MSFEGVIILIGLIVLIVYVQAKNSLENQRQAYRKGFDEGYWAGKDEGFDQGCDREKEDGFEESYDTDVEEENNVGENMVERWLSQTDDEFLNEQFDYSPICKRCGKGKEGHRVIAVMGSKFADCISKPLQGPDGEPWGG